MSLLHFPLSYLMGKVITHVPTYSSLDENVDNRQYTAFH